MNRARFSRGVKARAAAIQNAATANQSAPLYAPNTSKNSSCVNANTSGAHLLIYSFALAAVMWIVTAFFLAFDAANARPQPARRAAEDTTLNAAP
jgi:hypothetical protein